jgi:hypothetical protein
MSGDAGPEAGPDGDRAADVDREEGPARPDAEAGPVPGPLTILVREMGVTADRVFDLDGDGQLDNSLTNLGSPDREVLASALSAGLQAQIEDGTSRFLFHFPWVDDLSAPADPDALLIVFKGCDTDESDADGCHRSDPANRGDDFSGDEPYYVKSRFLDACGEPRYTFVGARVEHGALTGRTDLVEIASEIGMLARGVGLQGDLGPWGSAGDLLLGLFFVIHDLGLGQGWGAGGDDRSALEFLLAGGEPYGMPLVPGLTPDIDVDGDGLERFGVDAEGRVEQCIDGDGSVIDGRDCWQEAGMADGISMTLRLETTTARVAGPEPGWEQQVEGECSEPPEHSLWDPP